MFRRSQRSIEPFLYYHRKLTEYALCSFFNISYAVCSVSDSASVSVSVSASVRESWLEEESEVT